MLLRRLARPLLSAAFIAEGIEILQNPQPLADRISPVLDATRRRAQHSGNGFAVAPSAARPDPHGTTMQSGPIDVEPNAAAQPVTDDATDRRLPTPPIPESPETAARIIAGVQIASAALLAIGKAPRPAAAALSVTTAVNLSQYTFWSQTDPELKRSERAQFLAGLSKLGGVLIATADTEGQPSLGWRGRRAAHHAKEQAEALAASAAAVAATARERSSDFADTTMERLRLAEPTLDRRGRKAARKAKKRTAALADVARERGAEIADTVRERGPILVENVRERGSELADLARDRAPELADAARERAHRAAELTRAKALEFRANHL